jgi:hypothetical protein
MAMRRPSGDGGATSPLLTPRSDNAGSVEDVIAGLADCGAKGRPAMSFSKRTASAAAQLPPIGASATSARIVWPSARCNVTRVKGPRKVSALTRPIVPARGDVRARRRIARPGLARGSGSDRGLRRPRRSEAELHNVARVARRPDQFHPRLPLRPLYHRRRRADAGAGAKPAADGVGANDKIRWV